MSIGTPTERVAKSIKLLDDNADRFDWLPASWRELIDLDKLDMSSVINCILGQLYRKVNPNGSYEHAEQDMFDMGINLSSHAFGNSTEEWRKQIKEGLKASRDFEPGTIWYYAANSLITRTVLAATVVNGVKWITYHYKTLGSVNGVQVCSEAAFTDRYSTKEPVHFEKGDKLRSADSTYFYYFTDDKVVKLGANDLQWADLAYFEKLHGKMSIVLYGAGDHYFSGEFFWNDNDK